eukprot:m.206702 g.206702  ORF g.206702 m.206702 type:complete len:65 (-) comp25361_c0_seq5:710-904(-)
MSGSIYTMTIIDDILGPFSLSNIFGDLGLPSMSTIIHDGEMLLLIAVGGLIVFKLGGLILEEAF